MPGDSEHPVTLGDLRVAFEDGWQLNAISHRPATVADLVSPEIRPLVVSALRAEGVIVIEKVYGEWPEWATRVEHHEYTMFHIFDALAEAQPSPPAGGVS